MATKYTLVDVEAMMMDGELEFGGVGLLKTPVMATIEDTDGLPVMRVSWPLGVELYIPKEKERPEWLSLLMGPNGEAENFCHFRELNRKGEPMIGRASVCNFRRYGWASSNNHGEYGFGGPVAVWPNYTTVKYRDPAMLVVSDFEKVVSHVLKQIPGNVELPSNWEALASELLDEALGNADCMAQAGRCCLTKYRDDILAFMRGEITDIGADRSTWLPGSWQFPLYYMGEECIYLDKEVGHLYVERKEGGVKTYSLIMNF